MAGRPRAVELNKLVFEALVAQFPTDRCPRDRQLNLAVAAPPRPVRSSTIYATSGCIPTPSVTIAFIARGCSSQRLREVPAFRTRLAPATLKKSICRSMQRFVDRSDQPRFAFRRTAGGGSVWVQIIRSAQRGVSWSCEADGHGDALAFLRFPRQRNFLSIDLAAGDAWRRRGVFRDCRRPSHLTRLNNSSRPVIGTHRSRSARLRDLAVVGPGRDYVAKRSRCDDA